MLNFGYDGKLGRCHSISFLASDKCLINFVIEIAKLPNYTFKIHYILIGTRMAFEENVTESAPFIS